jgi:large subunit ribosomal protein L31
MAQAQAKTKAKTETQAPAAGTDIHPKQHLINVVMTDKTKFQVLTTWGKEGDTLILDVDPKNHPAWQKDGQKFINANDERVTKFKSKFGNFDFVGGSN